jgi:hypothetical protein
MIALASNTDLVGDRDPDLEFGDKFFRILTAAAPAPHLGGSIARDVGFCLRVADYPTSLLAEEPGPNRPGHIVAANAT